MRSFFNMEGPFFTFMSRVADLISLNLLFLLCSIPIVTIGASYTAMSYVMLKIREGEEGYIVKPFFKAFKENFKQATLIWLIMMAAGFILFLDLRMTPAVGGTLAYVIRVMVIIAAVFWVMIFLYVFPLTARFVNTIGNMLRNAFLIALANLPRTLLMIALWAAALIITFYNGMTIAWGALVWMMIGFSLICYFNTGLLVKIFHSLMPKDEEEKDPDAWQVEETTESE